VPIDNEHSGHEVLGNATPAGAAASNAALASRFHQMFPVLSETEIDRVRRFGEVRRFSAGELLFQAGEAVPGMYVILLGRVAIEPRDGLGQAVPVATVAQMIGAPLEEMTEVVPGEVIGEIGQLSGRPDLSVYDARAVGDVEAIVVPPEALRALLVAEAELGERILRALILRRVALIELGFGGPVLVGTLKSPDVTRLSHFLERNGIPFRVVDPDEDQDAAALLARFTPKLDELPIAVLADGTVLKNPTKQEFARALGLVATSLRSEPYDVVIVGAGPAGLATAVYGASEGLAVLVLEALAFGGQAGASARIENYLGFPTGVSGQALMARAFTQAQKFGTEFSLSTEVTQLDCTPRTRGMIPCTSSSLPTGGGSGRARSWSPPARAIAVQRFRTSRSSKGAACRTGPRPSRPGCAAMRTWRCWVAETQRARRQCSSRATRVTCACSCAGQASQPRCRATSSNG
jgi:thioredoxin reductase (NADPH)